MTLSKLRSVSQQASRKRNWSETQRFIDSEVEEQFRDLARCTVPFYIAGEIANLPTSEERHAWLNSIPDDCYPAHAKDLITMGAKRIYRELRKRR